MNVTDGEIRSVLTHTFAGFLPTVGHPPADQPAVGARPRLVLCQSERSFGIVISLRLSNSYRGLAPHYNHAHAGRTRNAQPARRLSGEREIEVAGRRPVSSIVRRHCPAGDWPNSMDSTNPYVSPSYAARSSTRKPRKSVVMRLLIGFCVGASIPTSIGAYGLYQFNVYVASLPPEEFVCGNGALGPLVLIVFGAPFLGIVGAVVAAVLP